jgi:hypothetical protein
MDNIKKRFDPKKYYIENKEKILTYNRLYFKEYYRKKKLGLLKKDKIPQSLLIIERNVRVTF